MNDQPGKSEHEGRELKQEKLLDLRDIVKLIETTATQPTDTPRNVHSQIRIVVAGGVASLYVYDVSNNKWRASSLGT